MASSQVLQDIRNVIEKGVKFSQHDPQMRVAAQQLKGVFLTKSQEIENISNNAINNKLSQEPQSQYVN